MNDEPDDVAVDPPAAEAPAVDPEIIEEARLFGWKAPEEWVGDKPAGYIDDPSRFVDRLKSSRVFKTLEQRFEDKLNDVSTRLGKVAQKTLERQKADHDAAVARIASEQRKAVEVADVQAFERLEREKKALVAPVDEPPAPKGPSPVVTEYVAKNDWARDPVFRTEGAQAIDIAMRSGMKFADDAEQLAYAESVMKRRYPHLFTAAAPAPSRASRVDGGGLGGAALGNSGAFEKLPAEARSAFKKFVAQGIFADTAADRARYVEDYNA